MKLKAKEPIPFAFVLEALESLSPEPRPMFGCLAFYVGEKIMGVLRGRESHPCELILRNAPRIGKVPDRKKRKRRKA